MKHTCQERECPSFGHPSSTGCRCHKAPVEMLTEENTRLRKALYDIGLEPSEKDKDGIQNYDAAAYELREWARDALSNK